MNLLILIHLNSNLFYYVTVTANGYSQTQYTSSTTTNNNTILLLNNSHIKTISGNISYSDDNINYNESDDLLDNSFNKLGLTELL